MLSLFEVSKWLNQKFSIRNLSLDVRKGEFFCFLGPSGSGKSTILGLVGGWLQADKGVIRIGSEDVTRYPAHRRSVRTCFQKGGFLFPHMTVAENIGYALKVKGESPERIRGRTENLLEEVGLAGLGNRRPLDLSGGEAQRVAIARAIADPQPILLLDEIESGLDRRLRESIRELIVRLAHELELTVLYVTHDSTEALATSSRLNSRIAVIRDGQLEQVGTAIEVYDNPVDSFTASLTGEVNILELENFADATAETKGGSRLRVHEQPRGRVRWALIRPEWISLSRSPISKDNVFSVVVGGSEFIGGEYRLSIRLNRDLLRARWDGYSPPEEGEQIFLGVDADRIKLLEA